MHAPAATPFSSFSSQRYGCGIKWNKNRYAKRKKSSFFRNTEKEYFSLFSCAIFPESMIESLEKKEKNVWGACAVLARSRQYSSFKSEKL